MDNIITFAFLVASFGQIALCLSLLLSKINKQIVYLPLSLFFISSGIACTLPAWTEIWPELNAYGLSIALPCLLLQPVALWFYVEGITSSKQWQFNRAHYWHLLPFLIAVIVSLASLLLPQGSLVALFIEEREPNKLSEYALIVSAFILLLFCLCQSSVYLILVFRRLIIYRALLKQLFSSNEHRELAWLFWLSAIIGTTWFASLSYSLPDLYDEHSLISSEVISALYFFLVWSLAVWGLRQKPGFEGRYLDNEESPELEKALSGQDNTKPETKYKRSALEQEQVERIAKKVHSVMQEQNLYLDENLSLHDLAKKLRISPNYLSQTLNDHLKESFFDYVNRWRIEHAKRLLTSKDATILDIAMESGFNAKSSFYKSFKRCTGQTPSEYKQQVQ